MKTTKIKLNTVTVASLRRQAAKVRVIHQRRFVADPAPDLLLSFKKKEFKRSHSTNLVPVNYTVSPKGGKTVVEVDLKNGHYYKGEADVSNNDYYDKQRGLTICLGRIVKQALLNGDLLS